MAGPDDSTEPETDPEKVALAAASLIEKYGNDALERAVELERGSAAGAFAAAVRIEVARRLAAPDGDK